MTKTKKTDYPITLNTKNGVISLKVEIDGINKDTTDFRDLFMEVGLPRFELGMSGPESEVLPLHHSPIAKTFICKFRIYFSTKRGIF